MHQQIDCAGEDRQHQERANDVRQTFHCDLYAAGGVLTKIAVQDAPAPGVQARVSEIR